MLLSKTLNRLLVLHLPKPVQIALVLETFDLFSQQPNSILQLLTVAVPVLVLLNGFEIAKIELGYAQLGDLHLPTHRSNHGKLRRGRTDA